jgi:hypothetical protein
MQVARRGKGIYEREIRAEVEPKQEGRFPSVALWSWGRGAGGQACRRPAGARGTYSKNLVPVFRSMSERSNVRGRCHKYVATFGGRSASL